MSKDKESTRVKYTGASAVEVCVGPYRQTFQPNEVAEIKSPYFRADLLDREDFELVTAKGKKAAAADETTTEPPTGGVN